MINQDNNMDWKEFFKPTTKKVVLLFIFCLLLVPLFYIYEMGFTHPNSNSQCFIGNEGGPCDKYCKEGIDSEFNIRKAGVVKASEICCCVVMNPSIPEILLGVYSRSLFFIERNPIGLLLLLTVSYLLSLCTLFIYTKFKK